MMLLCMEVDSKIFFFSKILNYIVKKMEAVIGIIPLYIRKIAAPLVSKNIIYAVVCNAKLLIIIESMFFITSSIKFL